jgi:hypothetical protein
MKAARLTLQDILSFHIVLEARFSSRAFPSALVP